MRFPAAPFARRLAPATWWLWAALGPLAAAGAGDDVVRLRTGRDGRPLTLRGQIIEYTGQTLRLRTGLGAEQTIPADRVVDVQTSWPPAQVEGDRLMAAGQYERAVDRYRQAYAADGREWVRRRILEKVVWCRRYQGRWADAGDTFLTLYRSDPTSGALAAIPLCWRAQSTDAAMERRAAAWLARSEEPAAVLLGASWLLAGARRGEAAAALAGLADAADGRLAFLAEAQRWRLQAATASEPLLDHWRRRVRQAPLALRPGPTFVLAAALAARGRSEEAVLAWLRIPILHPEHRTLAAESLLAAGRELEKLKRDQEAITVYRELLADYGGSAAAAARNRLQRVGAERPAGDRPDN